MRTSSFRKPLSDPSRAGMTLIELLVAMAIAVMVMALAYSLYRTVSMVMRGQNERAAKAFAVEAALDQIQSDLAGAFLPEGNDACLFMLNPDTNRTGETASLSFCLVRSGGSTADLRWSDALHVDYVREAQRGGDRLLRMERFLNGPLSMATVRTNVLAEGMEHFHVELYDGGETWQESWPPAESRKWPRAARVSFEARQNRGRPITGEFLIPAGLSVTSDLVRTAAPDISAAP